jgi:S-(hydroxymethyl)mycothiol dehydrogenase
VGTETLESRPDPKGVQMHEVQGVVARGKGEPVSLETVLVPDPGPGEALVRIRACGVCHTDLHYREGGISDDFPFLLGHEAAGEVVAVGDEVRGLDPGAFVILNWRAVCGSCRACRRGKSEYCFATFNASQPMTLADGTPLSPALGIGAFAELSLVAAGQCTEVPTVRAEAAGLLGCGVMAGIGAAMHTGAVGPGDSVAVFGCGGVGAAAVAGARLAGATTIIAVDLDDQKLKWATELGATHTVNSSREDPVEAVRAATGSFGADVAIEAVGRPEVLHQAFYARDLAGTVVQVGVPTPDMALPGIPMIDFFGRGGALKPSWYGDCLPSRDFPMLIEHYRQGRLDLDHFVSEVIGLGDVEEAFGRMGRGEVLRSVVRID